MTRSHSHTRYAPNACHSPTAAKSGHGHDPAALLARGYSARSLGAVITKHVSTLTEEEMERDLRHITAYQEAATRYHQLTYASSNRLPMPQTHAPDDMSTDYHVGTSTSYAVLPVRIDPEEEKRAAAQAKRIQRAEAVREELEQHYVALRAHYVVTTQELQQLQTDWERTLDFLQATVASTATTVAHQRARLEVTRHVAAALGARRAVLGSTTTTTAPTDPAVDTEPCLLLAAWLSLEQAQQNALTKKGKKSAMAPVPWACTTQPSMAPGIPILLSALSNDPCQSLATGVGPMLGSKSTVHMTWLESHFSNDTDTDAIVADLRTEVDLLHAELVQEREANQALLVTTHVARTQQDEWVAMIALVRQETEAVLHRHNVLLESDEVRDAVQASVETETAAAAAATATMEDGDANEADDEGMEEEGEEGDDWEGNSTHKRSASAPGEDESPGASRKRRKV